MSFTKIKNLYIAINHVVAELGKEGKIDRPNILVQEVMMALHAIDQGEFKPDLFDRAQTKLETNVAQITQLQAEVEALRKDAERYQWLCNKGYNYHEAMAGSGSMSICRGPYILLEPPSHNKFSNLVLGKQAADVLIDTAIAKDTQEAV